MNSSGGGGSSGGMLMGFSNSYSTSTTTTRSPFTVSQWQELEHQALIFKYMVAGLPVPPDLVLPIQKSFESISHSFFQHPTCKFFSLFLFLGFLFFSLKCFILPIFMFLKMGYAVFYFPFSKVLFFNQYSLGPLRFFFNLMTGAVKKMPFLCKLQQCFFFSTLESA